MKLEQSFVIEAPLDSVWEALTDVERVAPCLPGATLGPCDDEGLYEGTFAVKLGPATAAYQGTLQMVSLDLASHTTTIRASGRDKRGQGSAKATIVSRLLTEGHSTRIDVVTDFTITGRLARFGRGGMIQDVSNRLLEDFASALQAQLSTEAALSEASEAGIPASAAGTDTNTGAPNAELATTQPPSAAPRETRPSSSTPREIHGFSLLLSVLRARMRRLFRSNRT